MRPPCPSRHRSCLSKCLRSWLSSHRWCLSKCLRSWCPLCRRSCPWLFRPRSSSPCLRSCRSSRRCLHRAQRFRWTRNTRRGQGPLRQEQTRRSNLKPCGDEVSCGSQSCSGEVDTSLKCARNHSRQPSCCRWDSAPSRSSVAVTALLRRNASFSEQERAMAHWPIAAPAGTAPQGVLTERWPP